MDFPPLMVDVMHEEDDDNEMEQYRVPKRYLRDLHNPIEHYSEEEFRRRYRFSKVAIMEYVLPKISTNLEKPSKRGLPISPLHQLLLALRFYATGSIQTLLGDVSGISQPTVSRIVGRVTNLLAIQMIDIIRMPRAVEAQMENRRLFMELQKRMGHENDRAIPNVDGAIDCTHVRLISTKFQEMAEIYRNRKSYFSLNVQAVVGPRREFLDLVTNWPGSSHDSRIFQNSRINHRYSTGELTGALLGDAGYRSLPYLFTPFANPQTEGERRYNAAQIRGRNVVERTFGILKKRFPCLSRGLSTKLETSTTIIVACAVLHNMALIVNDNWLDDEVQEDIEEVPVEHPNDNIVDGLAARREVVRLHFE